jgi:hypothetical protein
MLTKRSIEVLLRVERMMENATRALATAPRRSAARRASPRPTRSRAADEAAPRGN